MKTQTLEERVKKLEALLATLGKAVRLQQQAIEAIGPLVTSHEAALQAIAGDDPASTTPAAKTN